MLAADVSQDHLDKVLRDGIRGRLSAEAPGGHVVFGRSLVTESVYWGILRVCRPVRNNIISGVRGVL